MIHFSVRVIACLAMAFSITQVFRNNDFIRIDATAEQLSSLSDGSIALLEEVNQPVEIDAFVSPAEAMPEQYANPHQPAHRSSRNRPESRNVTVSINAHHAGGQRLLHRGKIRSGQPKRGQPSPLRPGGRSLHALAKGFVSWSRVQRKRRATNHPIRLQGIARGIRNHANPQLGQRTEVQKKLGVFATDAPMLGTAGMGIMGFNMGGGTPAWEVINELAKQYDAQEVTGGSIVQGDYDALMVVQPSTLDNAKLDELIAAIKAGIPTAIVEDPLPLIQGSITGTYEPRRHNQQGGGPGQPPPPAPEKGDLQKLWDLLGVHFNVNPEERLASIKSELIKLRTQATNTLAQARGRFPEVGTFFAKLNDLINKASEYEARVEANAPLTGNDWDSLKLDSLRDAFSGLDYNHPIRNYVEQKLIAPVQTRLAGTGKRILHDPYNPFPKIPRSENFPDEFVYVGGPGAFFDGPVTSELQYCLFTCPGSLYENPKSTLTFKPLLKTRGGNLSGTTSLDNFWTGGVFGSPRRFNPDRTLYRGTGAAEVIAASITGTVADGNQSNELNVILVADADVLADPFFNIRSRGPDSDFPLDVDNVTFSLNLIDQLGKEDRLLEIRNRRRLHRTLEEFEKSIEVAREVASSTIREAEASIQGILQDENRKLNEALADVQNSQGSMTQGQFMQVLQTEAAKLQKNLAKRERELRQETNAKVKEAERSRDREIRQKQETIQNLSVFLPPFPFC